MSKKIDFAISQSRRVYADLVRRRSTVRVIEASAEPDLVELNFVLGLYRSGTTVLRYSLSSHPSVASPPETDFLDPLLAMRSDARAMDGVSQMGFDGDALDLQLRRFANYFYANYASSLDAHICVDKTPRYTFIASELLSVFSESRAIALFRNPFGQVRSVTDGLRSMPTLPYFESDPDGSVTASAAYYWLEGTEHLVRACNAYPDRVLPVPYEALCREPERWLRAILAHLNIPWDPQVLGYDPSKIDTGNEGGKAAGHRKLVDKPIDITAWTALEVANVSDRTSALAQALGYQHDKSGSPSPEEFHRLALNAPVKDLAQ